MTDVQTQIEARLRDAVVAALGEEYRDADLLLGPATNVKFGDYQANLAMGLAKRIGGIPGAKPREIAEKIVAKLDPTALIEKVEIAGPGFINLTLTNDTLDAQATAMLHDASGGGWSESTPGIPADQASVMRMDTSGGGRLGVPGAQPPVKVVVDYSSPNVAKEMHIGHLRSTIIGDCIARVLRFLGHEVVRQNHLGDWGTQFGMLLQYLDESAEDTTERGISDLNAFYQAAKKRFDEDAAFAGRARERVVKLQGGDADTIAKWQQLVAESLKHFDAAYARLNVLLTDEDVRGESAYNDALPRVVEQLEKQGLLAESQGAQVVYPEGFTGKDGEKMPMIVRKSDGGYLYATTDLAAARYRLDELGADRVIYVTDARQSQHFAMVFQTLRQAGWSPQGVRFDHVPFGTILGKDRKPFKTREGGTVKLADVLDEAEQRAGAVIAEKNPELPAEERMEIARVVGIGALKYADLSNDRIKDYVFDWDRMLALEGNTAPYLINAYVRIQSIFRKAPPEAVSPASLERASIHVGEEAERMLALQLLQFPAVVYAVADSLEPHRLCGYLYELATRYHKFYEHCPVLKADDEATRASRLALCALVARTLQQGLELLGIGVVERM